MGGVVVELISQFGILGLLMAGVIYLIVDGLKTKKKNLVSSNKLDESIDKLKGHVDTKIDDVNKRIDIVNEKSDTRYDLITKRLDSEPKKIIDELVNQKLNEERIHFDRVMQQFEKAPKLHSVLKLYRERIGCDHIFFGTFHNGGTSISGIPYCKFDITAEKFKPDYNNNDRELAIMYKNSDVLVHDSLPMVISQEDYVYYRINEDGTSELQAVDDILYRRCVGRGVKQIAINLIRDPEMNPVGFVGCLDFNYDNFNFKELNNCAKELEEIYR